MHLISRSAPSGTPSLDVLQREYNGDGVTIKVAVPRALVDSFIKNLSDISSGKIKI